VSATKTTIVAILVVLLTFTAGVMVGVFASHMMILRGGHGASLFPARAMVHRLDRRLDLTNAQRAQVEQIIRRHHARIDGMWDDLHPRIRTEIDQANADISRILTPEQRAKFEQLKFHIGGRFGSREGTERRGSTK
jgi:Spy/CpxP family protein refolding chaperone